MAAVGGDEEESDWNSSNIKGFSFGDDDENPWEDFSRYQGISAEGGAGGEIVIDFDSSGPGGGVVSDRVKAASRIFSSFSGGPSISDVVGGEKLDFIPSNDPRELRAELATARRQLAKLEVARYTALHPKETVKNIFLGKQFSLEFYRSYKDKADLLDEAIRLHDGDAILTVVLFVRRTLSPGKFLELVASRPVAVRHLSNYLETRLKLTELNDLLTSVGQHERAAIIQYKSACVTKDLEARTRRIKALIQNSFNGHPDTNLLIQHVHLLERIAPVIAADARALASSEAASLPSSPSLSPRRETVLETLLYCCYHHWGEGENLLHSPASIKKTHNLTEKQYIWIALIARAKKQAWKDCAGLVLTKGWLGGRKTKSAVAAEGVVRILHENGAPVEVLQQYLPLVEDGEEREALARKCGAHSVVVDCLVQQRDRVGLQRLMQKLQPDSTEWRDAEHALNASGTKWKN